MKWFPASFGINIYSMINTVAQKQIIIDQRQFVQKSKNISFFYNSNSFTMFYNIIPANAGRNSEQIQMPVSETSFCVSDISASPAKKGICYQYVNPSLLLQWQGIPKKSNSSSNQFSGTGIFRVYERSKDGSHKSKLVLSMEAQKWKQGKPCGQIKFMQVFFYDQTQRKDNVVKQVRKFTGKMENMLKQGAGVYTIEFFCSNQTKQLIEVKGTWSKDMLVEGKIYQNGRQKQDTTFINNIQISNCFIPPGGFKAKNENQMQSNECHVFEFDGKDEDEVELQENKIGVKQNNKNTKQKSVKNYGNSLNIPTNANSKRKGVRG